MDKEQKKRATWHLKKTARKSFIGPFNPGFLDNLPHTVLLSCRKNQQRKNVAEETKQGMNSKFARQTKEGIQRKPLESSKDAKKRKCDTANPQACVLSEGAVKQLESLQDACVVDKENTSFSLAANNSSEKSKNFNPFKKLRVGAKIPRLKGDVEKRFNVNKVENKFNNRFPPDKDTRNPVKKAIGVLSKTKRLPGTDINNLNSNLVEKESGSKEDDLCQMSKVRKVCGTVENDRSNIKSKDRHKVKVKYTSSSDLSKTSRKGPGEPYNGRGTKSHLHGKNKMDSKRPRDEHVDEKIDNSNKREHKQKVQEYHNGKTEIGKRKRLESDALYSDPLRTNERSSLSTDRAEKRKKPSDTTEKKDSSDSSVMNTPINSKDTTSNYPQTSTKKPNEVKCLTSTSKSKLMEEKGFQKKRSELSIVCSDSQKDNKIKKSSHLSTFLNAEERVQKEKKRHSSNSKTLKVSESVKVKDVKRREHMPSDGLSKKNRHKSDSSKMSTHHRTKLSESSALKKDKEKYKDKRKDQGKQNLDLKEGMEILEPHRSCTTEENSKESEKTLPSKDATKHKRSKSVDTLGLSLNTLQGCLKHAEENPEIMDKDQNEIHKKKKSLLSDDVYGAVKFQPTGDSVSTDNSNKDLPKLGDVGPGTSVFPASLSQKPKDASVPHKNGSETENQNADLHKLDNIESKTPVFPTGMSLCQKSKDALVPQKNDPETKNSKADLHKLDNIESNTPVFPTSLCQKSEDASVLHKNHSEMENPKADLRKLDNIESNSPVFPASFCQKLKDASVPHKNDSKMENPNADLRKLDNRESNSPVFPTSLCQKSEDASVPHKNDSETENPNADLCKLDNIESNSPVIPTSLCQKLKDASVPHKNDSEMDNPKADLRKLDNKESNSPVFPTSLCQKSNNASASHENDSTENPNAELRKLDNKESNSPVFPTPLCQKSNNASVSHENDFTENPNADLRKLDNTESNTPVFSISSCQKSKDASGLNKNESETKKPKLDIPRLNNVESNTSVFPTSTCKCQMSNTASVLPKNDLIIALPKLNHVDPSVFPTSMCQKSSNVLEKTDTMNVQRKCPKQKFKSICSKSDLSLKLLKHHPMFCRIQKPISRFDYTKDIPEKLNLFEDSFEESFPESPDDRLFIATDDNESSDIGTKLHETDDSDSTLPADDDDYNNSRPTDNLKIVNNLSDQISSEEIGSIGLPQKQSVQSNSLNLFDQLMQEGFPDEYAKQKAKGCSQNSDDCGYASVVQQSGDNTPDISVKEQLQVAHVTSLDISCIDGNASKNDSVLPDRFCMPSDTPEEGLNADTLNIKAEPGLDNGSSVLRNDGLTFSTPKKTKNEKGEECLWGGNTSNIASVKEEYGSYSENDVVNLPNLSRTLSAPSSDNRRLPQLSNEIPTCPNDLRGQAMYSELVRYKDSPVFSTSSNQELDSANSLTQNSNSNVSSEEVLHQNVKNSRSYAGSNTSSGKSAQFTEFERLMRNKQLRDTLFKQKEMPIPIIIYHWKKTSTGSLVKTNGILYPQLFYSRGNKCVCCLVCLNWMSAVEFMVHYDNLPPNVKLNHAESLSKYQIQFRGELNEEKCRLWNQFCGDLAKFKRWTNSEGPQSDSATSGTINSDNRTFEKNMDTDVMFINGKVPKSRNDRSQQTTSAYKGKSYRTHNPIDPLLHPGQGIEQYSAPLCSTVHRSYNPDKPSVVLHHGVSTESVAQDKHHGHFSRSAVRDQYCDQSLSHGLNHASIQSAVQDPHYHPLSQQAVQDSHQSVSHQSTIQDQHHASHQSAVQDPYPFVSHLTAIREPHHGPFRQSSLPGPHHRPFRQSSVPDPHGPFSQSALPDPCHRSFRQSSLPDPHHGPFMQPALPDPCHSSFSQSSLPDPHHGPLRQSALPDPCHSSFSQSAVQDLHHGSFSQSVLQDPHHDVSGQSTVQDQYYASNRSDVSNNSPLLDRVHGCNKSTTLDRHHGPSAQCGSNHSIPGQSLESSAPLAQYPDNPLKSSYQPDSILDHPTITGSNTISERLGNNQIASVDKQTNSTIIPVSNSQIVSSQLKNMETLELLSLSQKCHSKVLKRLLSERNNHSEEIKMLKLQLNGEIKGRMELQSSVTTLLSEVDKLKAFISGSQLGETRVPPTEK